MKDEFVNRLMMFQTALGVLDSAEHKPTWFNQAPTIFTTKVAAAVTAVGGLTTFAAQQGTPITGAATDKEREEEELETVAHRFGCALGDFFRDQNDETNAAKCELSLSGWRALRDQALLEKSLIVRDLGESVVAGPQAALAAQYNINAAAVQELTDERDDYAAFITAPQQSIAGRKSLTEQFRPRFKEVEAKFASLDCIILQFNTTEAGRALIAAYQAARVVRDAGAGPSPTPTPPTPPAPSP